MYRINNNVHMQYLISIGEISICLDTTAYFAENPESEDDVSCISKSFDFSVLNIKQLKI